MLWLKCKINASVRICRANCEIYWHRDEQNGVILHSYSHTPTRWPQEPPLWHPVGTSVLTMWRIHFFMPPGAFLSMLISRRTRNIWCVCPVFALMLSWFLWLRCVLSVILQNISWSTQNYDFPVSSSLIIPLPSCQCVPDGGADWGCSLGLHWHAWEGKWLDGSIN